MNTPQFKEGNLATQNEKQGPLYMLSKASARSIIGLHFSQLLLCLGFVLILLNNLNVLAPGAYFGAYSWVTVTVFSIGMIINFISIPHLYFSSFINFEKNNDFWDKETFWILPSFFFGTFFLYGSQISTALFLLLTSIAVIAAIHIRFIWLSWKFLRKDMSSDVMSPHYQYFMTLKYLTVYYMMLVAALVVMNPLQKVFVWIRLNM